MARTGYALSIACGLLWAIILTIAAFYMCSYRHRRKRRSTGIIYIADATENAALDEEATALKPPDPRSSSYSRLFRRKRDQVQSHWIWLAAQFVLLILFTVLLATGVLLGFAASSELHANLASAPTHEETVGRLLTPAELERITPPRTYVFPRILRALAQIRAYLAEFVHFTKLHTSPVVSELINATEQMQHRLADEFNSLLFDRLGITEAFELGDQLGINVISMIRHSIAIVKLGEEFVEQFDRFKMELHNWIRLISNASPSLGDPACSERCSSLRATFLNNLTARPDTFMPPFPFAIALKFVTTDQNQTAETVQEQLNRGRLLAAKQLAETKKIMAERLDIPKSIHDTITRQWDALDEQMRPIIQLVDQLAPEITRSIAPRVSSVSTVALAFGCCFWTILLLLVLGTTWLILQHYCIPKDVQPGRPKRIYRAAGCGFFLLSVSILMATTFFFVGGYMYSETCRYLDPSQERITVLEPELTRGSFSTKMMLPLDSHINEFINNNWVNIVALANKANRPDSKPMPVPHIRSPIYALMHNCRNDLGVLEALDAIRDFNMSSLNDPEMSAHMIAVGREIMLNSLESMDVQEMFPKETDDQLAMAGRLDDFIVNFEDIRVRLPDAFVSIRISDDTESNVHYTPFLEQTVWKIWDEYYVEVIKSSLTSKEHELKLSNATEQVQSRFNKMSSVVAEIDNNLRLLSYTKPVKPVVLQLSESLSQLKILMSDKPTLLKIADRMFDEHIAAKTPLEAAKLIDQYGPHLMAEVGRCRRLYDASMDFHGATCRGVVSVVNGIWFVTGWVTLTGTLLITFGLLLLGQRTSTTLPNPRFSTTATTTLTTADDSHSLYPTRQPPLARSKVYAAAATTNDLANFPAEFEQLTEQELPTREPLQMRDV